MEASSNQQQKEKEPRVHRPYAFEKVRLPAPPCVELESSPFSPLSSDERRRKRKEREKKGKGEKEPPSPSPSPSPLRKETEIQGVSGRSLIIDLDLARRWRGWCGRCKTLRAGYPCAAKNNFSPRSLQRSWVSANGTCVVE